MLKKIIIGIIIVILVVIVAVVRIDLPYTNEKYVDDSDYLYDLAINHLLEEEAKEDNPDHTKDGYHFFATYEGLGITEKDDKKYVYAWIYAGSYYLENSKPKELSSYSIFHRFTFENGKIIKVEIPKDGSYYSDSVKSMCPDKKMENKVLNNNFKLSLKNQVIEYYNDNKYSFKAKIIESNNGNLLVEVLEDNNLFKTGSKVSVNVTNYEVLNLQYEQGMLIDISFDGQIEESYPPRIHSSSIGIILGN